MHPEISDLTQELPKATPKCNYAVPLSSRATESHRVTEDSEQQSNKAAIKINMVGMETLNLFKIYLNII